MATLTFAAALNAALADEMAAGSAPVSAQIIRSPSVGTLTWWVAPSTGSEASVVMIPRKISTNAVAPMARPTSISPPPTTNHQPLGRGFPGGGWYEGGGAGQAVMAPSLPVPRGGNVSDGVR